MKQNTYYVLSTKELLDDEYEEIDFFTLELVNDEECDWPWYRGIKIDREVDLPVKFKIDSDEDAGAFPDYVAAPIPIVTGRFKDAMTKSGVTNVDYYPVRVEGSDDFENFPEYFAINIIGLVSAHPKKSSTQDVDMSGADIIENFSLTTKDTGGLKIFRLAEQLATVVIDDTLKEICTSTDVDLVTLHFTPTENWSN